MKISYYITDIEQIDSNEYQEVVVNAVQRLLSLYDDDNGYNLSKLDYNLLPPHIVFNCALSIYFRLKEKYGVIVKIWDELLTDEENGDGFSVKDDRVIATIWGLVYGMFQNQRNPNNVVLNTIEKKVKELGQPYLYFETVVGVFKIHTTVFSLSEEELFELFIEECPDKARPGIGTQQRSQDFEDWRTDCQRKKEADNKKKSFDEISTSTIVFLRLNRLKEALTSTIGISETKMLAVKSFIEECLVYDSQFGKKEPWCRWFTNIDYESVEVKIYTPRNNLIVISDKNKRTIIVLPEESGIDVIADALELIQNASDFLIVLIKTGYSDKCKYVSSKELENWHNKYFPGKTLFFYLHPWAESCPVYKKIKNTRLNEWARCAYNLIESGFVTPFIDNNEKWKLRCNKIKLQPLVYWCYRVLKECCVWEDNTIKGSLKRNFDLFDSMFVSKDGVYSSDDLRKEFDRITDKNLRSSDKEEMWNLGHWEGYKKEIDKLINLNRY